MFQYLFSFETWILHGGNKGKLELLAFILVICDKESIELRELLDLASIVNHAGIPDSFAYSMTKGAVYVMMLTVAKVYLQYKIRCNYISPACMHTFFVDGFLKKNYPGKEKEMFEKLSKSLPIGRIAKPEEIAFLYLCSNEASFKTGCNYPIDGRFINLNN